MEHIRVLLANHHPIVRNGLRSLLERDSKIRVVGEAANGREAIVLTEYQRPDVAILDLELHSVRGIDVARTISSKDPKTRVVFVSGLMDEGYLQEAFNAGARGYVLGDSAQADLVRAVSVVAAGGMFLSPLIGCTLIDDWNRRRDRREPALTEHEKRLFSLLAQGHPEAEIALILEIPEEQARSESEGIRSSLRRLGFSQVLLAGSRAKTCLSC
ncbi:MAG TPA: response regulator transcription factor [Bryobacteraceae bacterium]